MPRVAGTIAVATALLAAPRHIQAAAADAQAPLHRGNPGRSLQGDGGNGSEHIGGGAGNRTALPAGELQICKGGRPLVLGGRTGLLMPLGGEAEADLGEPAQRALYLSGLLWCFLGVAIVADVFMGAIEKITSKKIRRVDARTQKGETVKVWNDTVANLTLMAFGSSAPEILLSIIELLSNRLFSGSLGPATIVGSAAFNLFCIPAICVSAIPLREIRRIKNIQVFAVTAFFSVFAYVWLLYILTVSTPDVITVVEASVTLLLFPLMVLIAYLADIGWFWKFRGSKRDAELVYSPDNTAEETAEMRGRLRQKYGEQLGDAELTALMEHEFAPSLSWAQYRMGAIRAVSRSRSASQLNAKANMRRRVVERTTVGFAGTHFSCFEGQVVRIPVRRAGDDLSLASRVMYRTRDGSARRYSDYAPASGTLVFAPSETAKEIQLTLHGGESSRVREFYVDLHRPQHAALGGSVATVVVIGSSQPGVLSFERDRLDVAAGGDGPCSIVVRRKNGASGKVGCSYHTEDASAIAGEDYQESRGELVFHSGEERAVIAVDIRSRGAREGTGKFRVVLTEPTGGAKFDPDTDGGGASDILTVAIAGGPGAISCVRCVGRSRCRYWRARWRGQFAEACYVGGSREEQEAAGVWDWAFHLGSFPWKFFLALVPPADLAGGWPCFCCALLVIAVLTAAIGDLANLLGCAFSMSPSITAITFVALGTSLPDTMASRIAAIQEPHADASIGNVTGSNAVNVFVGLGFPWLVAALYWAYTDNSPGGEWYLEGAKQGWPDRVFADYPGGAFVVEAETLGVSVAAFSACACAAIAVLLLRRSWVGGELGGGRTSALATSAFLVALWAAYLAASVGYELYGPEIVECMTGGRC